MIEMTVLPASFRAARDRVDRRDAHAAADADHRAVVLDLGGVAQRPGDGGEASPTSIVPICMVDLPTSWKMRVIVPAAGRNRRWSAGCARRARAHER